MIGIESIRGGIVAAAVLAAASVAAAPEPEQAQVVEAGSDVRVVLTHAMESLGFGLQEAHDFAVMAADGIDLQDQEDVCFTYLVTVWWCEGGDNGGTMRMARFRMDEGCFGSFFPPGAGCEQLKCPPGSRRYYTLESGIGSCFGVPSAGCVHMEVCGPVESSCGQLASCDCLALQSASCDQVVQCVPTLGEAPLEVPAECPACN